MKKHLSVLFVVLTLSGCGAWLKSDYQRPTISVPPAWRVQDSGSAWVQNSPHWWDNFSDPLLSSTINRVLVTNNDLAKAGLQLKRARLDAGLTDTNLTPNVTLGGAANNSRNLNQNRTPRENYSASLGLSYELDLWGKLARNRDQALWISDATEQDRQNTALTLIGNTADLYWQIANLNQQVKSQHQGVTVAQQTQQLVEVRYNAGAVGKMDLLQAQQSLLSCQNQLTAYVQQRESARNALAILFDTSPLNRQPELSRLDTRQDVTVAQVMPVEVIANRPDIQAAEWRLRAALAGSDAAKLSFYPTLSLSSTLSAGSAIFSQWFNNPAQSAGAAVALPFVQWNTVQLTVEKAGVDVQEAEIDFRTTVYKALADVDNAQQLRLSSLQQREKQQQDLQLSQQRLALAQVQYREGAVSFQTLLDAQDALLNSEVNLTNTQYNYLSATMKLMLALGGGVHNKHQQG